MRDEGWARDDIDRFVLAKLEEKGLKPVGDADRVTLLRRVTFDLNRSVYLPLLRGWVPTALEVFDFAEQGMVTGSRDATTVSPQALYLLNDPFVRKQSRALAQRLLGANDPDDAGRVELAYLLTLGRKPTATEAWRARGYVADYEAAARDVVASAPPQVVKPEPVAEVAAATVADGTDSDAGTGASAGAAKKAKEPVNPDEIVYADELAKIEAPAESLAPREAAWASFCQALIGSAEFRYLR